MLIILSSCAQVEEVPPENLIGEEKMADLIFELAVLDAAKGFVPKDQNERISVDSDSFYRFHEIDSIHFTISNAYYAKQPKKYLRILNLAKKKLDILEKTIEENEKISLKIDSIQIMSKPMSKTTK